MKIVKHPYHASIIPQPVQQSALWHCVVRRNGSAEILARHDAVSKEDACCAALLEIVRLKRTSADPNPALKNAS
jgi:hypothetical protein